MPTGVRRQMLLRDSTPRPWHVQEFDDSYGNVINDIRPEDGKSIIVNPEGCYLAPMERANLDLIVHAVNEHEIHCQLETAIREFRHHIIHPTATKIIKQLLDELQSVRERSDTVPADE